MWYEHHPYKVEIVGSTPTATTTRKHPANKKLLLEIATERFHEFESRTSILTRMLVEWLNTAIVEQNVSENADMV